MLLGLYLGTTAYVWIDSIKTWKEMDKRLKKEGYVSTGKKRFVFSDIFFVIFGAIALSLPIFNLIFPIANHDKDATYDSYKNYLEEAGSIELVETKKEPSFYNEKLKKVTGIGYISNIDNILELEKQVKPKQKIGYISSIDNIIELEKMVNEQESSKTINVNDSKLQERINRNGHVYYSSIEKIEHDSQNQMGYTYKKVRK